MPRAIVCTASLRGVSWRVPNQRKDHHEPTPLHPEKLSRTGFRPERSRTCQSCIDCHGADGNKPIDPTYPKLGGQYGDYLAHSLQAYRAGDRQHALMTPQATDLSDQDIADLAAYFGSRPTQLRDLHGLK